MQKRAKWFYTGIISSVVLLSGCVFEGEQSLEEMDPPVQQDVNVVDDLDNVSSDLNPTEENDSVAETVNRELYLLDQNGMVVPQTLPLPKMESKEVAQQSLEYLIKGGPVTNMLPDGFQAVLPQDTRINGLNLKEDGTLIVDLSQEFSDYRPEDEQKILQALTFTLTEFENVKRVKLQINGYDLEAMPVNGTPISQGVSRANGINIFEGDVTDLTNSRAVTVYYPSQKGSEFYYVPVTTRIEGSNNSTSEVYKSIVQKLVNGPTFDMPLLSVFGESVELLEDPTYDNGVLTLSFNEAILSNFENSSISSEVMNSLVLSLTEQPGVEAVSVKVENLEQVFTEQGEALTEPVVRPEMTNTGSF